MAVDGLETPVPPVMSAVVPAADVPSSFQTVVRVRTVGVVLLFTLACTRINSGSYGAVTWLSWNKVTAVVVKS